MPRPKTLEEFTAKLSSIEPSKNEVERAICKSCRERYDPALRALTEGYCSACAMEVFYGHCGSATEDIQTLNHDKSSRQIAANESLVARQREGMRRTSGG